LKGAVTLKITDIEIIPIYLYLISRARAREARSP